MRKLCLVLLTVLILGGMVFATGTGEQKAPAKSGVIKIGLSFSDFATERWPVEQALMTKLGAAQGAQVFSQVANHDTKLQNDQIENMVLQGVNVIIIIAEDGAAAATAVDEAAKAGVKTIAYDRLIKSPNISAYISFDNTEVGRAEARGVIKVLDHGNFMLMGGSPTDNNAVLVRNGQMEVLKPLIDSGKVKIVADQWVENWDPANATKIMENVLTAQNNNIDAVVASNDGTAGGAIQALKAQGLAGKVPISGQDATAAGCNYIVKGEQTVTVYKDIRLLSPLAIDMAIKLAKGQPIEGLKMYDMSALTLDKNAKGQVPCEFLPVVQVDKSNVYDEIVKSGFQSYDDVYRDIPDDQRPARP
ncbi:MAG: substrate-binding domain-containing protein [Spirochaetia bacterium]|jgi:D-xylose transport system substrate-binding protein